MVLRGRGEERRRQYGTDGKRRWEEKAVRY
jgi:hypothetical protein